MSNSSPKNVILFGETGIGKSSIINLMAGEEVAKTSPDAKACTLEATPYSFPVDAMHLRVYDTVGLEEPDMGINTFFGAMEKACKLVEALNAAGGIDLLLLCVRAGRITAATQRGYRLFFEFLCDRKVPLALIVTHLEHEDNMEDWWIQNAQTFKEYGIDVIDHVCITAAPPRLAQFAAKRAQSQCALRNMLYKNLGPDSPPPYVQDAHNWFVEFILRVRRAFLRKSESLQSRKKELAKKLERRCSLSADEAKRLAGVLVKDQ